MIDDSLHWENLSLCIITGQRSEDLRMAGIGHRRRTVQGIIMCLLVMAMSKVIILI